MRFYKNKQNHKIAYKSIKGRRLGIIFIHGLNSDMHGAKALTVQRYARKNKLNFIRFDCRGHGKSEGKFEEFTMSDSEWNELVERNKRHLRMMVAKDYWTNEDMTAINAAIED